MATDPKTLARRWFEEVWNQGQEAAISELMSPDGVVHGLGPDQHGPEGFKPFFKAYRDAFPDIQVTIESIVSEGDLAAVRWTAVGTHKGNGLGFPATGKRVELTGMAFLRAENGRLIEGWNNFDQLGMLQQVGVVSLPA
jgi:steroid delta-isomerase-like uncharacterized protein